jgi:hypothetical protein
MHLRRLAGLLCLLVAFSLPRLEAAAQESQSTFASVVAEWNATLEQVATDLAVPALTESHAQQLKKQIADILASARQISDTASTLSAHRRRQISRPSRRI